MAGEYLLVHGWYRTARPCHFCQIDVMNQNRDGMWKCDGCGAARLSNGYLPEAADSFKSWHKEHMFLFYAEQRVLKLRRVNAVEIADHPLGITVCRSCDCTGPWLAVARITSNGIRRAMVHCSRCGRSNPANQIAQSKIDASSLPVLSDCATCNGETVGYVTRSKEGTYRCPTTGTEFGLHNCKPFWLATNCQGHTLAVQANRQDALWWVLRAVVAR